MMKHAKLIRSLSAALLLAVLVLALAAPAQAYTGRSDSIVVIEEGEVVEDDLYAAGEQVVVKGTIKGDLLAVGSLVTIEPTGVIEGDLFAAGQGVVVKGEIQGDVRIAGYVLVIEDGAQVSEDLLAFGYSLDVQRETTVGQDALLATGVASLAGKIDRHLNANAAALKLDGEVGGNAVVDVGDAAAGVPPTMIMQTVSGMPSPISVPAGLTLGSSAAIAGDLTYTAVSEKSLPEGVVVGETTFNPRPVEPVEGAAADGEAAGGEAAALTVASKVGRWAFDFLRGLAGLLIVGLILAYFFPNVLREGAYTMQTQPAAAFLWGLVVYVGFFFVLAMLFFIVVMAAVILGIVSLGQMVWTVMGVGALAFTAFTVSFHISVSYLSKVLVGYLIGRWLVGQVKPDLAGNMFWPGVLGILIFALVTSIPWVGWVINIFGVLFGLGALALMVRKSYLARKATPAIVEA